MLKDLSTRQVTSIRPVNIVWGSLLEASAELKKVPAGQLRRKKLLQDKIKFLKRKLLSEFPKEADQ